MAEAPQLPPDPFATLPPRAGAARPDPPPRPLQVGVVLAAGRSERLDALTRGGSKALLRLGGLSLVERAVRTLLARGLERVLVVVGHDAGPVATVVGRLGRGRVRAVYADRWRDGNGASLAAVEGEATVAGEALFALVTADHVFAEGALDRLLGAAEPAVLVDSAPDRAAWQEGCKVRIVDRAVVAFGKHLDEPAIDCDAFLLPPEVFGCQRQVAAEGDQTLAGAWPARCWSTPHRSLTGSMGRSPGCSCGADRGGRCLMGCWTGSRTRPSWPAWGCGRLTGTTPRGCWR
jgi:choline kinase